jgi:small conductance mechanosensitive channel
MALPANTPLWTQLQLLLVDGGIRLIEAVAILIAGWMLATWVKRGLEAGLRRIPMDLTLKPLIASLARYGVLVLTLVLVLGQFGFQTTSLIAVVGAAGLAIGLAMQGTLSNVAAGVMLLILRPFRVGHYIETASQQGTVREIGLFTTLLVTRDGVFISIPNSLVFSAIIVNYTRERTRRVKFTVPVDRASDLDLAEKTIVAALAENPLVLKEPPPSAVVSEIQEYSVTITARATTRSADYWKVLWAVQKDSKTALDRAHVPYPVNRQAPVVRNEPLSDLTKPVPAEGPPAVQPGDGVARYQ